MDFAQEIEKIKNMRHQAMSNGAYNHDTGIEHLDGTISSTSDTPQNSSSDSSMSLSYWCMICSSVSSSISCSCVIFILIMLMIFMTR